MTIATTEWLYALGYITFHVGFELMRVLCEAQGARCIAATRCQGPPRFAAVSGLNTTVTLSLQVVLQIFFKFPADFHMLVFILFGLFVGYVAAAAVRALLCSSPGSAEGGAGSGARGGSSTARADAALTNPPDSPDEQRYVQYRDSGAQPAAGSARCGD